MQSLIYIAWEGDVDVRRLIFELQALRTRLMEEGRLLGGGIEWAWDEAADRIGDVIRESVR